MDSRFSPPAFERLSTLHERQRTVHKHFLSFHLFQLLTLERRPALPASKHGSIRHRLRSQLCRRSPCKVTRCYLHYELRHSSLSSVWGSACRTVGTAAPTRSPLDRFACCVRSRACPRASKCKSREQSNLWTDSEDRSCMRKARAHMAPIQQQILLKIFALQTSLRLASPAL